MWDWLLSHAQAKLLAFGGFLLAVKYLIPLPGLLNSVIDLGADALMWASIWLATLISQKKQ